MRKEIIKWTEVLRFVYEVNKKSNQKTINYFLANN